ncbi:MAG: ribosomal protein S18-alanine N-acetyltransferase [Blastocatellia bacterium]
MTKPQHSPTRIRPLTEADLDAVEQIEAMSGLVPWGREYYLRDLALPPVILLACVTTAGDVAGFIHAWVIADEFQLNNMAVHPDWRRQGTGRALLTAALDIARAQGATSGALEVRAANTAAQALYARFGFTCATIRREYYRNPPDDAWLMTSGLNAECGMRNGANGEGGRRNGE